MQGGGVMRDLNLNGPKKRRGKTLLKVIIFIIIIFLVCFVFYEINQVKDKNKSYQKDNEKYELQVKDLEEQINKLKTQNEELASKVQTCSSLEKTKYVAKEGVFIEFLSNADFKEVNGTNEITGKYIFKDNVVTYNYLGNTTPYYYIISQDCKNLYKINYETNQIFIYQKYENANES